MGYICGLVATGFCENTLNMCGRSEETTSSIMVFMTQDNVTDAAKISLTKFIKNNLAIKKMTHSWCAFFVTNIPIEKCCAEMSPLQHISQPASPFPLPSWIPSYFN